jgi:hypothetical protein
MSWILRHLRTFLDECSGLFRDELTLLFTVTALLLKTRLSWTVSPFIIMTGAGIVGTSFVEVAELIQSPQARIQDRHHCRIETLNDDTKLNAKEVTCPPVATEKTFLPGANSSPG